MPKPSWPTIVQVMRIATGSAGAVQSKLCVAFGARWMCAMPSAAPR